MPRSSSGGLAALADSHRVAAIFTTGGTGVAARDVTPEATRAILHKEIPGLGELMRARGSRSTPMAALSRAIGGTRGNVLIVNLPGSPKGAVESLDAIVELVPHCSICWEAARSIGMRNVLEIRNVWNCMTIRCLDIAAALLAAAALFAQGQQDTETRAATTARRPSASRWT